MNDFLRHKQRLGYMTPLIVLIMITMMIARTSPVYKCPKLPLSENENHVKFNRKVITM